MEMEQLAKKIIDVEIKLAQLEERTKSTSETIKEFKDLFVNHEVKEMQKYDDINSSIKDLQVNLINQNWKMTIGLGAFLAVAGGIVNLDKLLNLFSVLM